MASESRDPNVAPAGEEIHLPGNSSLPLLMAVGITLALLGVTTFPIIAVVGTLIFLWTLVRWIRDSRHDLDELPEHH